MVYVYCAPSAGAISSCQNNMTMLVKDTNFFMYADDHQLYVTESDYNIASSRLQYQGKLAMSWYRDNFLLANTEKFQCLTINPRNIDSEKQDLGPAD